MKPVYKTLNFEVNEGVTVITIPAFSDNCLHSADFFYEFTELCSHIETDDMIRVVVITNSQEDTRFQSKNIYGSPSSEDHSETAARLPSLSAAITGIDRPVIAALNGDITGQGLELAMACDIRIATESSMFGLPHIRAGFIPCDGGTQRLPRLVGKGKALEMVLTGELIDAGEALRIGLVNRISSFRDIMKETLALAREMASKAPISLRFVREAIYKGMDLTLDQGLRMEGDLYLLLYTTSDRVEGITSFIEKKTPAFQGK
jgi:enoyl-CoA hydratase